MFSSAAAASLKSEASTLSDRNFSLSKPEGSFYRSLVVTWTLKVPNG